jgi:phage N-6-adenine-methyltransferase
LVGLDWAEDVQPPLSSLLFHMALKKVLVSSKSVEWGTPQNFYDKLNQEFNFTLDPCATNENHKCKKYFTKEDDGLSKDWSKDVVFMNPPYSRATTKVWIEKAYQESIKGAIVVCLIPANTSAIMWQEIIFPHAAQIRFIRGRLHFEGNKDCAPFSSAVIVFNSLAHYVEKFIWGRG